MSSYPRTLFYLIDVLCNEKCSKCGHWKYKSQKTINDSKYIIDFIEEIKNLKEIVFVGGEPLIYKKMLIDIISSIPHSVQKTIITNGVLADNDFIDALKHTNTHLIFSIDTMDKDFWKFVRGKDTYDKVFSNFYYAYITLNQTQISVQSVLAKETIKHVDEVGKWLKKLGVYHSVQDYVSDGFGGSWTELENKKIPNKAKCQAYKYNMSIMPSGDVYTCFQQPLITGCVKPLGNIIEDSYTSIISSSYFKTVINKMSKCNLPCKVLKCNIE
jgi:MoaA/NifB/PqqE/SkfB family radical SAM enzyme